MLQTQNLQYHAPLYCQIWGSKDSKHLQDVIYYSTGITFFFYLCRVSTKNLTNDCVNSLTFMIFLQSHQLHRGIFIAQRHLSLRKVFFNQLEVNKSEPNGLLVNDKLKIINLNSSSYFPLSRSFLLVYFHIFIKVVFDWQKFWRFSNYG